MHTKTTKSVRSKHGHQSPKTPPPFPDTGRQFSDARNSLGWTQEGFADRCDCSVRLVGKAEAGESISFESHRKLLEAINAIRGEQEDPLPPIDIPSPYSSGLTLREDQGPHGGRRSGNAPTPHDQAMGSLDEVISPSHSTTKLALLRIQTVESLREVWSLDQASYPEYNFAFEKLEKLWEAYPEGLYGVYRDDIFRGAMGIWPVTKEWADSLKAAQIREETFEPEIVSKAATAIAGHWYITGVVIQPALQGTALVKFLVEKRLGAWINNRNAVFPSEFLALGFSNRGQAILRNFGFELLRHGPEMPDLLPLYRLAIPNVKDFRARLRKRGLDV